MKNYSVARKSLWESITAHTYQVAIWLICFVAAVSVSACAPGQQGANTGAPAQQTSSEPAAALPFSENSTLFEILSPDSEARFLIDEILQGEDKRVVGMTNQVSGQIGVDFADPKSSAVGPIQINARSLETDNGFRNRAIQNRILLAGIYEFITFVPTAVRGLPEAIVIGEPVDFELDGDLTITAITKPVTFAVTVLPISDTRLEGSAVTTIQRTAFDLVVPSATGVAAVGEEVTLELDFTAVAVE